LLQLPAFKYETVCGNAKLIEYEMFVLTTDYEIEHIISTVARKKMTSVHASK
jgi:hypothetical protein